MTKYMILSEEEIDVLDFSLVESFDKDSTSNNGNGLYVVSFLGDIPKVLYSKKTFTEDSIKVYILDKKNGFIMKDINNPINNDFYMFFYSENKDSLIEISKKQTAPYDVIIESEIGTFLLPTDWRFKQFFNEDLEKMIVKQKPNEFI